MPREEPTEDIVRREIAAAREILRNDRILKSHRELSDRIGRHFPDKPPSEEPGNPDGGPQPPDPKPPAEPPKKKPSIWWPDDAA